MKDVELIEGFLRWLFERSEIKLHMGKAWSYLLIVGL